MALNHSFAGKRILVTAGAKGSSYIHVKIINIGILLLNFTTT